MTTNPTETHFTYYGDLVGISSLYNSSASSAYRLLNDFYNEVFHGLEPYYREQQAIREVHMFSDSLVVTGNSPEDFVQTMAAVCSTLLAKNIMLRGAMVEGKLEADPRLETANFQKFLPKSDVLARAATLEKRLKGARFLLDKKLAKLLIHPKRNWLVLGSYIENPEYGNRDLDLQRSIAPAGDGSFFEIHYPLLSLPEEADFIRRKEVLEFLAASAPAEAEAHYKETLRLFERSRLRWNHRNNQTEA